MKNNYMNCVAEKEIKKILKGFAITCAIIALHSILNVSYAQTYTPFGFEDGTSGGWVGSSNSESAVVNSNATYSRTGLYSIKLNTTSNSSNKRWYTNSTYDTAYNGTTVFFIYWAKTDVAGTIVNATLGHETSLPLSGSPSADAASYTVALSTSSWLRVTNAITYTSNSPRYVLPYPYKTSAGSTQSVYLDDGIIYSSTSSTTVDTVKPTAPTSLTGIANGNLVQLNWTSNTDNTGGTGVAATVILRNSNTSAAAPVLNDQAQYSTAGGANGPSSAGSGWQVLTTTAGASDVNYLDVAPGAGNYIYAVVLRDYAYNYSVAAVSPSLTAGNPSPSIFINQVGFNSNFGAVVAHGQSGVSSYSLTAYNLTAGVTVTAPAGFQVSLSAGSGFNTSVSIPQVGGIITATNVYVQYDPAAATGATGTLNITNTSTGSNTANVPVSGTAITTQPTTVGSISFGAVTGSTIVVNLPTIGNGTNRIIIVHPGSATTFVPGDGTQMAGVSADYSLATDQGGGNKVVYDGAGSGSNVVTVTGLAQATPYYFTVYEYNVATGTSENYLVSPGVTGNASTISITPTISLDLTGFTGGFGNTAVGSRSAQQQFNVSGIYLTNDITITPPPGFQTSLTNGGPYSSAAITLTQSGGLVAPTPIYVVMVPTIPNGATGTQNIALISAGAISQNVAVNGNALAVEPTLVGTITFGLVTLNSIVINLPTVGNGSTRIIVANLGSPPAFVPVDGAAVTGVSNNYTLATTQPNGGKIVYNGTGLGTSVDTVKGLDSGTLYYFTVYEYNVGTGTSENYFTSAPCGSDITTTLTGVGVKNVTANTPEIKLYPNPVTNYVYINALMPVNYVIHDMQGRALASGAQSNNVNLENLAAGMYIITITDETGTVLKVDKLIKTL
ncbi:MAG: T9SS type A sorting domain-containing protein [Flavipsychrobacter sp.]|nr:T9SS type A sorting domain-containing protein [Flavipsychrobacter sp.]